MNSILNYRVIVIKLFLIYGLASAGSPSLRGIFEPNVPNVLKKKIERM